MWSVWLLPLVLGGLALFAASLSAVVTRAEPGVAAVSAPLRDTVRLLLRQRHRVPRADTVLLRLGICGVPVAALLAATVVPVGGHVVADLAVGVVWFNAVEVLAWVLVWLVGWGSNSAYALVGGYRYLAQALAYELPLMFALTAPPLAAGTLRVGAIEQAQEPLWFVVWLPVAFVAYVVGIAGVTFWGPLSTPAGADLAGGVFAELSGVDELLLRAGRYLMLAAGAAFAVPMFLGGGHGPFLPAWAWWLVKTLAVIGLLVWLRRWPAVRPERLVTWGWLVLLPLVLLQVLVAGVVVVARGQGQ
ncbi:complex I subunit 1 family protein [Actinophytocola glycyrrhizae]|uniref:Complex I subunit 1 family protein n=1 Tax=Actinophytocola glycyrrhizae TaxID=2044873 RepID=A0ABV9SES5_9PSEU